MGVDYEGIGGIGIRLTDDMVDQAVDKGFFDHDEWDDCNNECLDKLGILYVGAGCALSGEVHYYFMVDGETYKELKDNIPKFVDEYNKIFKEISEDDLQVISDILMW